MPRLRYHIRCRVMVEPDKWEEVPFIISAYVSKFFARLAARRFETMAGVSRMKYYVWDHKTKQEVR